MENSIIINQRFKSAGVVAQFEKMLGDKTQGFISSVLQIVNSNELLKNASPETILNAAATAASLDLPINQSLGFSYIVPYKGQAQFQIGWKGFVQLAQRTGQYKRINVVEVYENQFKSYNALTEVLDADFDIEGDGDIVGYVAYFCLFNGMEKLCYWSKKKVTAHAKKYSKSFSSGFSPWNDKDQFHEMAKKTVLKNTLSKWGPMSIEMQTAHLADQSIQSAEEAYQYPDNQPKTLEENNSEEEDSRINSFIKDAKTSQDLEDIREHITPGTEASFNDRLNELKTLAL